MLWCIPPTFKIGIGGVFVLSTSFGLYPFLQKLFADGGYQGPVFQKASAKILPHLRNRQTLRSGQRVRASAATLGCRTHLRVA
jgi:hypothetical protein